jgi:Domain of unknown function (DUF4124)
MRLCRSWLVLGSVAVLSMPLLLRAAVVYKWIDADGVVHFSDQPVEGAEKIVTSSGASQGIMSGPAPGNVSAPSSVPAQDKPKAATFASTQVSIVSPAREQTFSGDESVTAALSVVPAPTGPVSITWTLNGTPVVEGADAMSFTLPPALTSGRGGYTLGATLTDPQSGESKSADPVTFNILRPSTLSPQHK